ncbi:4Fe-4S ferredoxin, iron-sulfur binding protein [Desulfamplus magnetovallimortis]|uniref:4Fe-4S ferredoxin, iron-sulfur binding protein n=1 Tax=Desulfamplus magnetovallimortis TaxID=1246637 RepID=A0A1W1HJA3_9BACT|nr:4Fe-4S binding protein [Desulfamplus magnetovallimortis]SLM32597.1 4Fe-4S ferredoxin, iron-sulfur binding protein [Desulfamplus magnetovallimortis]
MNIESVVLLYFSPTNTTKKTLKSIAQGTGIATITEIDLTPSDADLQGVVFTENQLVILGSPVYSGRIPVEAAKRFKNFKGNANPAVSVVLYGNREYEDALLELKNMSQDMGMTPVAGAAFIGEHSFSVESTPIAVGRPDESDLSKSRDFGKKIMDKIECFLSESKGQEGWSSLDNLTVPGNLPYKERKVMPPISPVTREDTCIKCGKCAEVCPTEAVSVDEEVTTRAEICLRCCACVKECPTGSRVMENPKMMEIAQWLSTNFSERKEPAIFI